MLLSAWTDDWVDLPISDDLYHAELQKRIDSSTMVKEDTGTVLNVAGTH